MNVTADTATVAQFQSLEQPGVVGGKSPFATNHDSLC